MRVLFREDNHIRLFHHAALHSLQLVSRSGQRQEHKEIHHVANGRFRLPGAYRFDEHRIVPGGFAQDDALTRSVPNAARPPLPGSRTYEGVRMGAQTHHARLVSKDAAPRAFARRVVGQHRHATIFGNDHSGAERLDEHAFPHARRSRDPDADGLAGQGQTGLQQRFCAFAMSGARAFRQRNAAGQHGAVPRPDAFEQCFYGRKTHDAPPSSIIRARIREAASVTGVPGPKIPDTPASYRNA